MAAFQSQRAERQGGLKTATAIDNRGAHKAGTIPAFGASHGSTDLIRNKVAGLGERAKPHGSHSTSSKKLPLGYCRSVLDRLELT
jgi:hypothetical protein